MKKKTLFYISLFFTASVAASIAAFFILPLSSHASTQPIKWRRYDEAMALARKTNKYVLVDFMAVWCGYCSLMQKTTYKDQKVLNILSKKFVLARVDIESEKVIKFKGETITEADLSMYYEVEGTPTTWFFDSRGNAIAPRSGYVTANEFHAILLYISGGHYKKMMFEEFVQKHAPR